MLVSEVMGGVNSLWLPKWRCPLHLPCHTFDTPPLPLLASTESWVEREVQKVMMTKQNVIWISLMPQGGIVRNNDSFPPPPHHHHNSARTGSPLWHVRYRDISNPEITSIYNTTNPNVLYTALLASYFMVLSVSPFLLSFFPGAWHQLYRSMPPVVFL